MPSKCEELENIAGLSCFVFNGERGKLESEKETDAILAHGSLVATELHDSGVSILNYGICVFKHGIFFLRGKLGTDI